MRAWGAYTVITPVEYTIGGDPMQIELGEKIRELRKRGGRTQEELAEALGVTNQAVSRWETGGSYPDLELLPSIANYFGVTIDELFGYESERGKKVNGFLEKIRAMNRENNGTDVCLERSIQFARACLAEFPDEKRLLCALASVLYNAGYVCCGERHLTDADGYDVYDAERHRACAEWREAVKLYEKALVGLECGELRNQAVRELLQLYANTGETEKAEALTAGSPDMTACREILRINGCGGRERAKRYGEALLAAADQCARLLVEGVIANRARLSPRESAAMVRSAIAVYGLVCTDGNYGVYHGTVAHMYLYLSEHLWLAGGRDEAFAALDAALEHAGKLESLRGRERAAYTAPLLRLNEIVPLPEDGPGIAARLPEDWPWWRVPDCGEVKAEMEADPRWRDWARRAKGVA